jgi:hypothetical protein
MQRWMQGKMQLAKSHGTVKSGAGRPTGAVLDDRDSRTPAARDIPAPSKREIERHRNKIVEVSLKLRKVKGTIAVLKEERPVAWGKGRKARRATA